MIDKIKDFFFIIIPISIVSTYFGCFGFYYFYNLDISTYINSDDLFFSYSKYTALIILYSYFIFYSIKKFLNNNDETNWWNKTIGKLTIRRKIIALVLPFILFFFSIFFLEFISSIISITLIILILFSIIYVVLIGKIEKQNVNLNDKDTVLTIYFALIAVCIIPIVIGYNTSKYVKPNQIEFETENETINTKKDSRLIYIGKNSQYIFIYNNENKSTVVYPMSRIKKVVNFNN
ncbi:hypothetical protein [Empedobacter tilapiae]|uniref:hypothetical protein n=1 Tax=Empedobacter tilapiae TaxID=2491114 RepID=UPI0028D25901|nr:hypothetical protein [Empedobacter tilapiae]